ncbi:hypothetical protein SAMN05444142_1088 [Lutimaribacter pacificus]|uniref:Glycine rich protein n=1 Tax=Lutimaribacter pacificus TaxID=391948 RepID=A0A1M6UKN4_9RHOB|nr:hypothetical protein [Lutimaribacter pacificus]SHK69772.1 hypothetical protein SAMN05444142_1088 [Lutimaribacter pacificus]
MFNNMPIPAGLALCIVLGSLASPAMADKRCTGWTAMFASSTEELCECDRLTPGFVAQIQKRSDFGRILEETQGMCSGLTVALTEVTTFSTAAASGGDGHADGAGQVGAGPGNGGGDNGGGDNGGGDNGGGDNGGGDNGGGDNGGGDNGGGDNGGGDNGGGDNGGGDNGGGDNGGGDNGGGDNGGGDNGGPSGPGSGVTN